MTDLRTAAQQALEALEASGCLAFKNIMCRCSELCGSYTAAQHLRAALAQQAEPVQEPVAWLQPKTVDAHSRPDLGYETCSKDDYGAFPVHTAPPRRTMVPLTEAEILAAVGWERAEMYMKLTPNFPVDEAKKETLKNARAIEKASWEKNHGQA